MRTITTTTRIIILIRFNQMNIFLLPNWYDVYIYKERRRIIWWCVTIDCWINKWNWCIYIYRNIINIYEESEKIIDRTTNSREDSSYFLIS